MAVWHLNEKAPRTLRLPFRDGMVRITLEPGRNTEEMLTRRVEAPRGFPKERLTDLLLEQPAVRQHIAAGRISTTAAEQPIPAHVPSQERKPGKPGKPKAPDLSELPPPPGGEVDKGEQTKPPGKPTKPEPLPWSESDKVEQLREALLSRGIPGDGMTKAELITALKTWDVEGAGGERK